MSAILDKTIATGFLAAVVFTALAHGAVEPWSVAVFEMMVIALALLWALKGVIDKRVSVRVPPAALPLAAFAAFALAQSVALTNGAGNRISLSMDVEATRSATLVLVLLLASFLMASNFFAARERLQSLAAFAIIYGFAMAVFALVQHFTWDGRFYWLRPNLLGASPFGPFVSHNHFAGYMELLIPVPVALIISRGARREARLLYAFAAAVMGVAAIASLSRGGMISLLASLIFIAIMGARLPQANHYKRRARFRLLPALLSQSLAVVAILAAIIIGIFWIGADPVLNRVASGSISSSAGAQSETFFSSRGWIWEDSLRMIADNWATGVGLGAFETAYAVYSHSDGSLAVGQAHNDYLQVLADCGIIGGALALWFIVAIFRSVREGMRSRDPLVSGLALASGGGIFAIMVHSLFDFNLQVPSNALLFLLMASAACSTSSLRFEHERRELRERKEARAQAQAAAANLVTGVQL